MKKQSGGFRGVWPILVTPFDDEGRLDEESLRAVVDFCIEAGSHGVVSTANASEWFLLSDSERCRVISLVIEHTNKRVPVIATVNGGSSSAAVEMAQAAQDMGADCLMAMPPTLGRASSEGHFEFYRALSEVCRVPFMIQNCHGPLGTPMSPELLARMVDELPWVDYVKEETWPSTHAISRTTELVKNKEKFKGIFGGQGAHHFMNEMARGMVGTMPAGTIPDGHVKMWDAYERGDISEARHLYYRILPILTMEGLYPMYKEVLRRRGVIRSARTRNEVTGLLDEVDYRELDYLLEELSDLLIVKGPFA
jgi:4-hydroxy-tetrahydrodipicolinate synthase